MVCWQCWLLVRAFLSASDILGIWGNVAVHVFRWSKTCAGDRHVVIQSTSASGHGVVLATDLALLPFSLVVTVAVGLWAGIERSGASWSTPGMNTCGIPTIGPVVAVNPMDFCFGTSKHVFSLFHS